MRPQMMKIFENMRADNALTVQNAKNNGFKVVGMFCAYSPQELVLAAGALPVSLCGTRQEPIPAAEKTLPRNLCPLIKSSFGFAVTDTCPYFRASDFVIAETTCDGKKKMFELLAQYKPLHVMHLPQGADRSGALQWWLEEMYLLKERLEEHLDVTINQEDLRAAIKLSNRERQALKNLLEVNRLDPAPLTGMDMLTAIWVRGFNVDKEEGIGLIEQLTEEIRDIAGQGISPFAKGTPRVLLTGCPVGTGCEKVVRLLEECGGSVVCYENCTGIKTLEYLADEDEQRNPMEAIAERYLQIPCSCISPNPGRLELISRLVSDFQVDGVVDLSWQACHTYIVEGELVRRHVRDNCGLPYIQLETDYSTSDIEQLKTRISAFIEMLHGS